MTALATSTDVEAVLGRTLTSPEAAKVDSALASASAAVREVTGRRYEAGTFTVRRRVRNGTVTLDAPASVTGVNDIDSNGTATALTGFTLRGFTVYNLAGCHVEVTYTSLGEIPDEVVSVTAGIAARLLTTDTPDGATSYTITKGPFTESASFDSATESVSPSVSELKILRRYALTRPGTLSLLG
jgi:hypothetical protein